MLTHLQQYVLHELIKKRARELSELRTRKSIIVEPKHSVTYGGPAGTTKTRIGQCMSMV